MNSVNIDIDHKLFLDNKLIEAHEPLLVSLDLINLIILL